MSRYKAYPEYKSSGVEWMGKIPCHWTVSVFKWHIERNDGGVWGEDPDGVQDTIVLRSTEQTVDGFWKLDDPAPRKLTASDKNFGLLKTGDLLVTKSSGSSLHIGKTTIVDEEIEQLKCCYSNFMQRIRTRRTFLPKLAWYVMNNELCRRQFDVLSNSTTGLANLNGTIIGQVVLCVGELKEQQKIANFLDHETAKIDTLIAKQQELIKLLKEKRQAVISHAVTKGLNPNAPMRDSGVEWLGDVPAHWDVWKFGQFSPIITCGIAATPEYVDEENGVPFLSAQNIQNNQLSLHKFSFITKELHAQLTKYRKPEKGDVLVTRVGAGIGAACVVDIEMEFSIYVSLTHIRVNPRIAFNKFIVYFFACDYCQYLNYQGTVTGGGVGNLNVQNVIKYQVPLPGLDEQIKIVEYLDSEGEKFSELIAKAESAISLMQERRTALISAAVTGKIDVRDWQPSSDDTIAA